MLSLINVALAFSSLPSCPELPPMGNGSMTCAEESYHMTIPVAALGEATSRVEAKCNLVKEAYETECCGKDLDEATLAPYKLSGGDIFADAGTHLSHAEGFSGAKVSALISATECTPALPANNWQHDPRQPANKFCAYGAFDGMNAKPIKGDGSMQSLETGKNYMRTYLNTEITGSPSWENTPTWFISTVEDKGGFGQPAPEEHERLQMWGAVEQFFDYDRETLEAVNGGHAIKKIYTANKVDFNSVFDATLTADQIYGIVTDYKYLHNNVQPTCTAPATFTAEYPDLSCPDGPTGRHTPRCTPDSDIRSCGINGHCGSKIVLKHEFSINSATEATYQKKDAGIGFEDDVLLIAEEGHPLASWSASDAITGTVQALDIATGNLYQLPHLSVGVIEMAFSVSTGHPDYIAVGIEEYGVTEYNGIDGGSRWNLWIGKKDKTSSNFLERNGLAPNSGRVYCFTDTVNGVTDMATFINWPESGKPGTAPVDRPGHMKPIERMFDGDYTKWTAGQVNTLKTVDGLEPVRMTRRGKQEWGAVNPDFPYQWGIAETGLGGSKGGKERGCEGGTTPRGGTADCEMGTASSTVVFLEADMDAAFTADLLSASTVTARNPAIKLPESIPAKVFHVLADQVYHGPHREHQRGFAGVDSLLWLRNNKVLASEDSYAPGGFNMGIYYDMDLRKSVPVIGAIGKSGITMGKMNSAAMAPFGSFSGATNQEITGFFDASAALSAPVPYTPQEYYLALDSKHIITNNQMKGSGGPLMEGMWYAAQTHMVILPDIDFATYPTSPETLDFETAEKAFVTQYGRYRRRALSENKVEDFEYSDWAKGHDDYKSDPEARLH